MKKNILLTMVIITLVNTVIFTTRGGCGMFLALPLLAGWSIVAVCFGHFFADNHVHLVTTVGAFVSACFLAVALAVIAAVGRKAGRFASRRSLTTLFIVGGLVYIALGLLNYPEGPCP